MSVLPKDGFSKIGGKYLIFAFLLVFVISLILTVYASNYIERIYYGAQPYPRQTSTGKK